MKFQTFIHTMIAGIKHWQPVRALLLTIAIAATGLMILSFVTSGTIYALLGILLATLGIIICISVYLVNNWERLFPNDFQDDPDPDDCQ